MAPSKNPTTTADAVVIDLTPLDSVKPVGKQRRKSSSVGTNVNVHLYKPEELKEYLGEDKDLKVSPEVAKLNWKMTTSPTTLDDAAMLKTTSITSPPVKKLTIFFNTGLHVTARASSTSTGKTLGVTIMDVLQAIHKQMKKRHMDEDEMENPVLKDLEWGRGEDLRNSEGGDWPAVLLVSQKAYVEERKKKH